MSTTPVPPPAGPWASTSCVPASSSSVGRYFAWSSWVQNVSGVPLSSVAFRSTTFFGKPKISAIQMWAADGSGNGFGGLNYQNDDEFTLSFSPGERVTSYTQWQNPANGGGIGRVQLLTDKGQTLDTAPGDATLGTGFSRPVGGGILCGALSSDVAGLDIRELCLLFLAPTVKRVSVTITDLAVNLLGTNTGISPVALESVHYQGVSNWTFGGTKSRSTTNSFTSASTTSYTATASVEISGKFLGIGASATAGFEWTNSQETTNEQSVTESVELNYSASGQLDVSKGENITCTALVQQGTANVDYTAQVTLTFSDATVSSYSEKGTYHNVSYSAVSVSAVPGAS